MLLAGSGNQEIFDELLTFKSQCGEFDSGNKHRYQITPRQSHKSDQLSRDR